jgi:hypothetical protein
MISMGVPNLVTGSTLRMSSHSRLLTPPVCKLVQKGFQDSANIVTIFGEYIPLLNPVNTFATRQGWLVKGDMADEIEGVQIVSQLVRKLVKKYSTICQLLYDGVLAVGGVPLREECIQRLVFLLNCFPRVVSRESLHKFCIACLID